MRQECPIAKSEKSNRAHDVLQLITVLRMATERAASPLQLVPPSMSYGLYLTQLGLPVYKNV